MRFCCKKLGSPLYTCFAVLFSRNPCVSLARRASPSAVNWALSWVYASYGNNRFDHPWSSPHVGPKRRRIRAGFSAHKQLLDFRCVSASHNTLILIYSTYNRRCSQEREASVLVSPQPAAQWGSAEGTPGQGRDHNASDPQSAAASEGTAGALSGGIEAMGKGWCIPPPKHSSTAYARVQSLGNGVSAYTPITC